jgi:hypothetical protein
LWTLDWSGWAFRNRAPSNTKPKIKADQFVLGAHGTPEELERPRAILAGTSSVSIEKHAAAA